MIQGSSRRSTPRLSMSDEISDIGETLARLQSRFASLQQKFDEETSLLKSRVIELETERIELIKTNKWLEHQIDTLESKVGNSKPDLQHAVDAREASIKKLRRTRRVLKDVINEYEEKFNAHPESLSQLWEHEQLPGAAEGPEPYTNSSRGAHHGSRDDAHTAGDYEPSVVSDNGSYASATSTARRSPSLHSHASRHEEENVSVVGSLPTDLVPEPKSYPIRRVSASGVSEDYTNWLLQFANPPASSRIKAGPISWRDLKDPSKFELDEAAISTIENLSQSPQLELCVHIVKNFAFIRDPLFLEDRRRRASYVLDWGSSKGNGRVKQYITTNGKEYDSVFHTFVFMIDVKGQDRWYYIGAQKWEVTGTDKIWNVVALGSRGAVLDKLTKRSRGSTTKEGLSKALDSGELAQITVQLTGNPYVEISRAQCLKMGYKAKEKSPK